MSQHKDTNLLEPSLLAYTSMDVEDRQTFRLLDPLNTSAWVINLGFWAYAIGTIILCAGRYTVKPVLSSHTKNWFSIPNMGQIRLNAGQKYCRMLS